MKHLLKPLTLAFILLLVAACKKSNTVNPGKGIELNLSATQLQQASGNNDFTFNLFRSVSSGNTSGGNLMLSPLSVSMDLGMTSNGASGATLDSMRTTLGFGNFTQDEVNTYYNKLITELPELDPNTSLKIANAIWYRQDFSVTPAFLKTGNTSYLAAVQSLDFTNPNSVNTINTWVSNQTNGKISKVISSIKSTDLMFLINAIYFKSIWANKFDPASTKPASFVLPDNSELQTNFMNGHIPCNFYKGQDATILELPYANDKYSMVLVMPASGQSLGNFVSTLNSTTWASMIAKLSSGSADVSVPKFQFTYATSLKDQLSAMGMGIAFSDAADFTNINPAGNLQITDVKHNTYIAVDETGTEAAAATTVIVGPTAIANYQLTIDHPFFFAIREMKSGLILFAGTVSNPAQTGL